MPSHSRSVRLTAPGGVRLHSLRWGGADRPPLVLLHGGGANAHWWDHLAPAFAGRFHVVALDFRGHGDSDYPAETYSGAFGDDLDALLEELGRPAVLVGHSMGAHVALDRAARVPGSRGLVLVDVAWGAPAATRHSARRALAFRLTYPTRERAVARFRFVPGAAHAREELRRAIAERSVREEPDGRFGFKFDPHWFSVPFPKLPPLGRVTCATLIVRGAESPLLGAGAARGLAAELPHARVVEVAGAGHHVLVDEPEAFRDAVAGFLADLA